MSTIECHLNAIWLIVDYWTIGVCAELCSSGAPIPSFIFVTFYFLITWYIGRF